MLREACSVGMRAKRVALALSVCVGYAAAGQCLASDGFVLVSGTAKLQKITDPTAGNLLPWERSIDGQNIVISNSCGFVETDYELGGTSDDSAQSAGESSVWRARALMGEWCEIGEFVIDGPTLIQFREWGGTNYMLSKAAVFADGSGRKFVADSQFIVDSHLVNLAREALTQRPARVATM